MACVMLVICGLFAWSYFGGVTELNHDLAVTTLPGAMAVATLVFIVVSYMTIPLQHLKLSTQVNYMLVLATIAVLVAETYGINSAFLSLLILLIPFGSATGVGGSVASLVIVCAFITYQSLVAGVTTSQLVALSTLCTLPWIGGIILWSRQSIASKDTSQDRSYHELANELSQVASTSDVVINAIGDGVIALDKNGIVQLINPAAQRLLGWGNHDATNLSYKSILKIIDSKNHPVAEANNPVSQALSSNSPQKNDNFSLETQSGKLFMASISVTPVGKLGDGAIVVFRDVTSEKSDERQRAEFISTASHEMRTPVASIEGYLGLALNPATATIDAKAREFITKAHESAEHLGRLFADLLDVSKADDSRLTNNPKVVDVVPFVYDIVEGLTPKATEKGLQVIYKPIPITTQNDTAKQLNPVFYANVDNDHLREVIQNLVENAIKYTPHGSITVDVTGDQAHIKISITDTGVGIPAEDIPHLFQKFYRVDSSDTREIGGTGLGLYLCRKLIETIGGRLWVESEYKKGSTFFVEVPRIDYDDAQQLSRQTPQPAPVHASEPSISTPPQLTQPIQPSPTRATSTTVADPKTTASHSSTATSTQPQHRATPSLTIPPRQ